MKLHKAILIASPFELVTYIVWLGNMFLLSMMERLWRTHPSVDQTFSHKGVRPMAQQPLVGQVLLVIEASQSHLVKYFTIGKTLDEWSARQRDLFLTTHIQRDRRPWALAGFEPTIPASERQHTNALDYAVTGIWYMLWYDLMWCDMIWYDMICCVALCIVCFVSFYVLFVCKCVLYFCHRVTTQLQLTNIWYDMIWCDVMWYDMIYVMIWYDMIYDMIWYMMWYVRLWYI